VFLQVRALANGILAAALLRKQEAQIVERQALGEAFLAQHVVHQRGVWVLGLEYGVNLSATSFPTWHERDDPPLQAGVVHKRRLAAAVRSADRLVRAPIPRSGVSADRRISPAH
jgi:hypothetical protein